MDKKEVLLDMRSLVDKIFAIVMIDTIDTAKLKDTIISLAYKIDEYEKEE